MRRLLLIVLLLLIVVVGATPYIMGGMAKSQIQSYWAEIDKLSGVKITFKDYRRGWFHSQTDVHISADLDLKERPVPLAMIFTTRIDHGPLLRDKVTGKFKFGVAQTYLELRGSGTWRTLVTPYIGNQPLFSIQSFFGFNDNVQTHLQSAKINYVDPKLNLEVKWDGIKSMIESDMDFSKILGETVVTDMLARISSTGTIPAGDMYRLHSHPLTVKFISKAVPAMPGIMISENHMVWPGLEFASPVPAQNGRIGMVQSDFSNQLLVDKLNYLFNLKIGDMQFGDQYAAGPLDIGLSVENIDAAAFSQIITKIRELVNQGNFDKAMAAMSAEEKAQFEKMALDIFKHGLVVDLKRFNLRYADDGMELRAKFTLPPVNAASQIGPELMNQMQADFYIKFPIVWQQEVLINGLTQKLREQRLRQQTAANVVLQMQMNKLQESALPGKLSDPANPAAKLAVPNGQAGAAGQGQNQGQDPKQLSADAIANIPLASRHLLDKSDQDLRAMATTQVTELLQKAIQLGIITQMDKYYVMDYQYRNGQLTVNGKVMAIETFISNMTALQASALPQPPEEAPGAATPGAAGAGGAGAGMGVDEGAGAGAESGGAATQPDDATSGDFLKQQEKVMKQLEEQQKKQTEQLNKELEKLNIPS